MNNRIRLTCANMLAIVLLVGVAARPCFGQQTRTGQVGLNRQLIAALIKGDDKQALALVNAGADPNTRWKPNSSPSMRQRARRTQHRLTSPVNDVNHPTALSLACGAYWDDDSTPDLPQENHSIDIALIQAMLTHGANVNPKGGQGFTPLMWAILSRVGFTNRSGANADTVRLLLAYGARVDAATFDGRTALILAASVSGDLIPILLEHGARVNVQDIDGETALHVAMLFDGPKDVVQQLLTHGANPNLVDKGGKTPLMLAQQARRSDIVDLLKASGARK